MSEARWADSDFASFPSRFAGALADARGAVDGIAASAGGNGRMLSLDALACLHRIYRLRVELEIESAAVLWSSAEVVFALADAIQALGSARNGGQGVAEDGAGIPAEVVELRRREHPDTRAA